MLDRWKWRQIHQDIGYDYEVPDPIPFVDHCNMRKGTPIQAGVNGVPVGGYGALLHVDPPVGGFADQDVLFQIPRQGNIFVVGLGAVQDGFSFYEGIWSVVINSWFVTGFRNDRGVELRFSRTSSQENPFSKAGAPTKMRLFPGTGGAVINRVWENLYFPERWQIVGRAAGALLDGEVMWHEFLITPHCLFGPEQPS